MDLGKRFCELMVVWSQMTGLCRLADQLAAPVDRPTVTETTASGAAYLAGLAAGLCPKPTEFAQQWVLEKRFEPEQSGDHADVLYAGWQRAVAQLLHDPSLTIQ